jgi:hypothetical protein
VNELVSSSFSAKTATCLFSEGVEMGVSSIVATISEFLFIEASAALVESGSGNSQT